MALKSLLVFASFLYIFVQGIVAIKLLNSPLPFRDHTLPLEKRVDDLISRLSIDEIINQTVCYMVSATPGIPRLDILPYVWDTECMRGQMMSNGTAFPQNLGLSASFRYMS